MVHDFKFKLYLIAFPLFIGLGIVIKVSVKCMYQFNLLYMNIIITESALYFLLCFLIITSLQNVLVRQQGHLETALRIGKSHELAAP